MTLQEFSNLVDALALNFGFKIDGGGADTWLDILFKMSSKFSSDDIKYGFYEMFKMTNKQWSEEYKVVYGKPPAVAVWVEFFGMRLKHHKIKEMALKLEKDKAEEVKAVKEIKNPVSIEEIQALLKTIGNNN